MINVAWHRAGCEICDDTVQYLVLWFVRHDNQMCSGIWIHLPDALFICAFECLFFPFHVDHVDHFFYKSFSFCFVLFGVKSEIYINKK